MEKCIKLILISPEALDVLNNGKDYSIQKKKGQLSHFLTIIAKDRGVGNL